MMMGYTIRNAETICNSFWSVSCARDGASDAAHEPPERKSERVAFVGGVQAAFGVSAVLAVGVVVVALLLPNRPETPAEGAPGAH